MNCTRLKQVLDAWIDGELDHATSAELGGHLESCPGCASLRRERDELRARVRKGAQYHRAPAALRSSVRRGLAAAAVETAPRRRPTWLQAAALACAAAFVSALAGYWLGRPVREQEAELALVAPAPA